jgi:hypothetical protein
MTKIGLLAVTDFSLHYNPDELRAPSTLLSVGVKLPGCEADWSGHLLSHFRVMNVCYFTFTPQYLMSWCLVNHKDITFLGSGRDSKIKPESLQALSFGVQGRYYIGQLFVGTSC